MNEYKNKKKQQLGMDSGTAANRLYKNILFDFITKARHKCFRCEKDLTRETFSVEHKIPWLDSEDPVVNFFDLNNIAYSHISCNSSAARKPHQKIFTEEDQQKAWLAHWHRRKHRRNAIRNEQRRQIRLQTIKEN